MMSFETYDGRSGRQIPKTTTKKRYGVRTVSRQKVRSTMPEAERSTVSADPQSALMRPSASAPLSQAGISEALESQPATAGDPAD